MLRFILLYLTFSVFTFANDSVFYMSGNQLVPVKETQIELRKEILKITKSDKDWAVIDIDFTFFNPGEEKTEIVGFVYSEAFGDFNEEPYLKDFSVVVNGKKLDHQHAKINKKELKDFQQKQDLAFYFPVTFKKGENKIIHKYQYRASVGVDAEYMIPYVLTTGGMWANGKIDDFTLIIDMGDYEHFSINQELETGKAVNWVVADGKISSPFTGFHEKKKYVCVGQKEAPLTFHKKDFNPENELTIIKYPHHSSHHMTKERYPNLPKDILALYEENYISLFYMHLDDADKARDEKLSLNQLRFLRNLPYAKHGYVFSDKKLNQLFNQFVWYFPQPNKVINLGKKEKAFVEYIKGLEKKLTKSTK